MFNIAARKKLIQRLRTPMRPNKLRAMAETLMKGTRYTDLNRFLNALLDEEIIQACSLESRNGKRWTLYSSHPIKEFTPHRIAAALFPDGYFCNLTAIYHHGLTNQVPNSVYVCHETIRPRKRESTELPSDSAIRMAFLKPHRHTNLVIPFQGHDLVVLDRVRDTDYGVVDVRHDGHLCPAGSRITCLERTLIDSVVAPQYSGGITSLPAYFKAARKKLNIETLIKLYDQLRFLYPYVQVIGFLLDYAGMEKQADQLRNVYPPRRKFFIDRSAKTAWIFNERWMLYHPRELIDEYCGTPRTKTVQGTKIYAYSRDLLVLEKLRAICQQHRDYPFRQETKNRARDFYDIYSLTTDTDAAFITRCRKHLAPVFEAKEVPIWLLGALSDDEAFVDHFRRGFDQVKDTVRGRIESFDVYLEHVRFLINDICGKTPRRPEDRALKQDAT